MDYLSKKPWHPGSMENIQIVWKKQQEEKIKIKKSQEMKIKLQEEKFHDQMKKLQVKTGQIPQSQLNRVDWIYQWKGHAQKTAQQYLLGKKIFQSKPKKDVKNVAKEQITNQLCQNFFKIHEDPLLMIKQKQIQVSKTIQNNLKRMKQIYGTMESRPIINEKNKKSKQSQSKFDSNPQKRRQLNKDKKTNKHKKHSRSRSQSPRQRSSRHQNNSSNFKKQKSTIIKSQQKSSLKQQERQYYQFIKQKYGNIAEQYQNGKIKLNFNKFKSNYQTKYQLSHKQQQQSRQRIMKARKQTHNETINN